jgi:hypothetical protein
VQITSDIGLSGAGCTTAATLNQLVQSSSENDKKISWNMCAVNDRLLDGCARQFQALKATETEPQNIFPRSTFPSAAQHLS